MKRFVLLFFILTCCFISINATPIIWNGGASGNWNVPANWTPATVPTSSDDVIFNSPAIVTMDILTSSTPYVINSLSITNGANVEFQISLSGNWTRILQVKSTDPTTKGLRIDGGCVLLMHGINTGTGTLHYILDLCGAAGVTGEISGELDFSGAGSMGTSDSTRLRVYDEISGNYANLVVKSGGVIKYLGLSGNTTSAAGSYLTMENGSIYEIAKDNGFFPQATWQPTSLCKASSPGTTVPGFVDGMTYGNLEWNCPNQLNADLNVNVTFNNVTFFSSTGQRFRVTGTVLGNHIMTINGNLEIRSGAYLDILGADAPSGSAGKIILKGNLDNQIGGVLITNGNAGTISKLELQGTTNQNITMNGTFSGVRLQFIMNGYSATLMTQVILPGDNSAGGANLQLLNGKIITNSSARLIMIDNSTVSGGAPNSFVSGPMQKRGNDPFIFPVGIGSIYAPIGMTNVSGEAIGDVFTAEYIRSNPQSIGVYGPNVDPFSNPLLNHVSFVEYWTLQQNTGSAFKKVSLTVNLTSFCMDITRTYVSKWNGSVWTNERAIILNSTGGFYQTGTIESFNNITGFTAATKGFTLSTDLPFASNPLPLDLISFDASKLTTTKALVNWELATISSPSAKFEVQRADANKNFSSIGIVNGSATDRLYTYPDNDLKKGVNYYRLKMFDENGKISYSRTVAVMNGVNGLMLTSLVPTVINSTATLTVTSSKQQKLDLVIIDMQGRVVQQLNYSVAAGNRSIQLSTDRLTAGIYQLAGITAEGKTNVIRFVKQ